MAVVQLVVALFAAVCSAAVAKYNTSALGLIDWQLQFAPTDNVTCGGLGCSRIYDFVDHVDGVTFIGGSYRRIRLPTGTVLTSPTNEEVAFVMAVDRVSMTMKWFARGQANYTRYRVTDLVIRPDYTTYPQVYALFSTPKSNGTTFRVLDQDGTAKQNGDYLCYANKACTIVIGFTMAVGDLVYASDQSGDLIYTDTDCHSLVAVPAQTPTAAIFNVPLLGVLCMGAGATDLSFHKFTNKGVDQMTYTYSLILGELPPGYATATDHPSLSEVVYIAASKTIVGLHKFADPLDSGACNPSNFASNQFTGCLELFRIRADLVLSTNPLDSYFPIDPQKPAQYGGQARTFYQTSTTQSVGVPMDGPVNMTIHEDWYDKPLLLADGQGRIIMIQSMMSPTGQANSVVRFRLFDNDYAASGTDLVGPTIQTARPSSVIMVFSANLDAVAYSGATPRTSTTNIFGTGAAALDTANGALLTAHTLKGSATLDADSTVLAHAGTNALILRWQYPPAGNASTLTFNALLSFESAFVGPSANTTSESSIALLTVDSQNAISGSVFVGGAVYGSLFSFDNGGKIFGNQSELRGDNAYVAVLRTRCMGASNNCYGHGVCSSVDTCTCTGTYIAPYCQNAPPACVPSGSCGVAECGTYDNGCAVINCGSNNGACADASASCIEGTCCVQTTNCATEGKDCGDMVDNCGTTLTCGPAQCGGTDTCTDGVCTACVPTSYCNTLNKTCGTINDGCETAHSCGECLGLNAFCKTGSGTTQYCCKPMTCLEAERDCGQNIPDGCGSTMDCGECQNTNTTDPTLNCTRDTKVLREVLKAQSTNLQGRFVYAKGKRIVYHMINQQGGYETYLIDAGYKVAEPVKLWEETGGARVQEGLSAWSLDESTLFWVDYNSGDLVYTVRVLMLTADMTCKNDPCVEARFTTSEKIVDVKLYGDSVLFITQPTTGTQSLYFSPVNGSDVPGEANVDGDGKPQKVVLMDTATGVFVDPWTDSKVVYFGSSTLNDGATVKSRSVADRKFRFIYQSTGAASSTVVQNVLPFYRQNDPLVWFAVLESLNNNTKVSLTVVPTALAGSQAVSKIYLRTNVKTYDDSKLVWPSMVIYGDYVFAAVAKTSGTGFFGYACTLDDSLYDCTAYSSLQTFMGAHPSELGSSDGVFFLEKSALASDRILLKKIMEKSTAPQEVTTATSACPGFTLKEAHVDSGKFLFQYITESEPVKYGFASADISTAKRRAQTATRILAERDQSRYELFTVSFADLGQGNDGVIWIDEDTSGYYRINSLFVEGTKDRAPTTTQRKQVKSDPFGSNGTMIGIIIGAILCILLVLLCIILFLVFVRRNQKQEDERRANATSEMIVVSSGTGTNTSQGFVPIGGSSNQAMPSGGASSSSAHYSVGGGPVASAAVAGGHYSTGSAPTGAAEPYASFKNAPAVNMRFPPQWVVPQNALELVREVGRGSFGVVYEAVYQGHQVAVKQVLEFTPKDLAEFEHEGQLMMKIGQHPNVVQLYGVCLQPLSLVTEFLAGGALLDVLTSKVELSKAAMLHFMADISAGLQHLHNCGIIHRDLAARNVLLDANWACKLADFGMSREGGAMQQATRSEVGPLKWMAPEAIQNQKYSQKTDIYSLGVVFSEILTRQEPYPGQSPVQVAVEVINKGLRPTIPDWAPQELINLIWFCFDTVPENRPDLDRIRMEIQMVAKIWY